MHHPAEELLLEHATGAAYEAISLFVATHCALCPQCRRDVAEMELLGGAMLTAAAPPLPNRSVLERLLANLGDNSPPLPGPRAAPSSLVFPEPLRSYMPHDDPAQIEWDRLVPGLKQVQLPLHINTIPVRVVRMCPGFVIPQHSHGGRELVMVLSGGYSDRGAEYLRGDVSEATPEVTHEVRVDDDEHCIALMVSESLVRPRSLKFWLATWFHDF